MLGLSAMRALRKIQTREIAELRVVNEILALPRAADMERRIAALQAQQTRLLHFDQNMTPPAQRSLQGFSVAEWERPGGGGRGRGPLPPGGDLKVTTTMLRPGWLRKNGVPYSENAKITEYIHRLPATPNGDVWLHVVTIVEDPQYLNEPFYTSTMFKREANGAKWNLSRDAFAEALGRSVASRFGSSGANVGEIEAYLESLYLEDLALACACGEGQVTAWAYFVECFRPALRAAARAMPSRHHRSTNGLARLLT